MAGKARLRVKSLNTVGFVDKGDDPKAEIMFFKRKVEKMIKEEGGKFCVYQGDKKMGEFDTREEAERANYDDSKDQAEKSLLARVLKALGLKGNDVTAVLAKYDPNQPRDGDGKWSETGGGGGGGGDQFDDDEYARAYDGEKNPDILRREVAANLSSARAASGAAGEARRAGRVKVAEHMEAESRKWSRLAESAQTRLRSLEKLLAEGADGAAEGKEPAPTTTEEADMFDVNKLPAEAQAEFKKLSDKVTELEGKLNPPALAPLPADVQKRIDETEKRANDLAEQVQKMQDQRENETFIAKAKGLGLAADDFGPVLRKISKALTAEEMAKLETVIKALQAQAKEAGLYKEIGRGGAGAATETEAKVRELEKEVQKANPTWNTERVRGEVMKAHPDLRRKLEDERMERTIQTGKGD